MKGRTIFTALATILLVSMVIVSAVGSAQDPSYDTTGARTDVFEDRALQNTLHRRITYPWSNWVW